MGNKMIIRSLVAVLLMFAVLVALPIIFINTNIQADITAKAQAPVPAPDIVRDIEPQRKVTVTQPERPSLPVRTDIYGKAEKVESTRKKYDWAEMSKKERVYEMPSDSHILMQ